jgi:branched-chain amino acid transport system permease protein
MPPVFNDPIALAGAGPFVVTVTTMQICIASAALAAAAGVLLLLARSAFGRQWRAFADDPQAAALFGVSPDRLLTGTFVLAGLLAGLAGWIVAVYYGNVGFAMGTMLGLKALVAAVLGGIGFVPGAFLGGLIVGLIEAGWSAYFDIGLRDLVVYAILIVVFVLRPGGLLGFASPSPRQV